MYWYRSKTLTVALICGMFCVSGLLSCRPEIKKDHAGLKYFDIKGFFERDSARLTRLNQPVFKTVEHNNVSESKKIHIANWGIELNLFKNSDINRPAWRDEYKVVTDSGVTIYTAKQPDLRTREIIIKQADGKVKWIMIYNYSKNILYQTKEKLSYFPDSLYLIEKMQTMKVLGTNKYLIKGAFAQ